MAIFLPTRSLCSRSMTRRPRLPASIAQNNPAAPPPMTITSSALFTIELQTKLRRLGRVPWVALKIRRHDFCRDSAADLAEVRDIEVEALRYVALELGDGEVEEPDA